MGLSSYSSPSRATVHTYMCRKIYIYLINFFVHVRLKRNDRKLYLHVYYTDVAVALGNRKGWGTKKIAASFAKSTKKTGHKSKVDRHSTGAHQKAATLGKFLVSYTQIFHI